MDGPEDSCELVGSDLIKLAHEHGLQVSGQKLARWIKTGLFVRGRRPGLGQGKGRPARVFPAASTAHFLCLCELTQRPVPANEVGWDLWWNGFQVDPKYWRAPLSQIAEDVDRAILSFTSRGLDGVPELREEVFDVIGQIRQLSTGEKLIRQTRRNLNESEFETFFVSMLKTAIGTFEGNAVWEERDSTDVLRDEQTHRGGLGLDRNPPAKRTKGPPDAMPRESAIQDPLKKISDALGQRTAGQAVEAASDFDLADARDDLRDLFRILLGASEQLTLNYGSDRRSLGRLKEVATQSRPRMIQLLLFWVWVGEKSEVRIRAKNLLSALREQTQRNSPEIENS